MQDITTHTTKHAQLEARLYSNLFTIQSGFRFGILLDKRVEVCYNITMLEMSNGAAKWGVGKAHSIPAELLEEMRNQPRDSSENKALLKLFTPDGGATWKLSEIDRETEDDIIFFGLCDLGMGFPQLGYVSLAEIAEARGALGLPIERDLWYTPEPMNGIKP